MNDDKTFADAPWHSAIRERTNAEDKIKALIPGAEGAGARFRQQHGHLSDFVLKELAQETPFGGIAFGMGSNFANGIVNFAMNTDHPEAAALSLLKKIGEQVREEIQRVKETPDMDREGFVVVSDGKISDYKVEHDLGANHSDQ
jgi:hypothetical protein